MNFACSHDVSITYSDCVFIALGIQHAMHMRRFVLPCVACLTLYQILPHYLKKARLSGKKRYET